MWPHQKIGTSVGLKVLLYLSLPSAIIFILFTSTSLYYVREASFRDYQHNATGIVKAVKTLVAPEDITNPAHFQATAEKIAKENRDIVKLHLHLIKGTKVYTAASTHYNEIGNKAISSDAEPIKTGKDSIKRDGDIVEVHTPLFINRKFVAVVGVYLSTVEEQARLAQLTWHLLELGALAAILLAAVMYFAFSRTILKPLSTLERATRKLALGNYELVAVDRDDELGQLATQFNYMLTTIARKEDETVDLYSKLERSYKQARSQAITDELTGLYNYRYFRARLTEELSRSARNDSPVSLAFIDIDNFKKFNDIYGHQNGDEALIAVADIVKKQIRTSDLAARYGGEELVVIFPETSVENAIIICERIRTEVENMSLETVMKLSPPGRLSVSIGLAAFPNDAASAKILIQVADKCMYRAKKHGKNLVIALTSPAKSEKSFSKSLN